MARMEISTDRVELASQTGGPDALFELGMLYATGLNVAADLIVAHKWFNLAAMRGNDEARAHRMELAREMSAAQIAEAQKLAREWLATQWSSTQPATTPTTH
jgi:TPR repeat protein